MSQGAKCFLYSSWHSGWRLGLADKRIGQGTGALCMLPGLLANDLTIWAKVPIKTPKVFGAIFYGGCIGQGTSALSTLSGMLANDLTIWAKVPI